MQNTYIMIKRVAHIGSNNIVFQSPIRMSRVAGDTLRAVRTSGSHRFAENDNNFELRLF